MKKYLLFKENFQFSTVFLCTILSLPVLLQSCEAEEELYASLDAGNVRYEYEFNNGTATQRRVSPSASAIAFNMGIFFSLPFSSRVETNNNSSFFKNRFDNTQFLATASKEHGPFYNDNKNLELNNSFHYTNAAATDNFPQNIRFAGGIEFVGKGGDTRFYYLEVPLYATYWANLKDNGKVFGGLGPYFAYGLGSSFGSKGSFNPFDAGVSARAGYKMFNSFSFSLGYDYGLVNISKGGGPNKETAQNRSISFNVGYPLRKLIKKRMVK